MDLQAKSLEELKAMAYDEGRKLEIARHNLQILNTEINNKEKGKDDAEK